MATITIKLDEVVKKFTNGLNSELQKVSKEVRLKGAELNAKLATDKTVQQALNRYQSLLKSVTESQAQLNSEIEDAVTKLQKSASGVEKNLIAYKKKALAQKAKLEKLLGKKTKAAAAKKTTKKVAGTKKAATTKKATTKKSV